MIQNENFYQFLNMSDFVVKELSKKYLLEYPELQKEFYKALQNAFCDEVTKNGGFTEISVFDNVPSYESFMEMSKELNYIFGVSTYCIKEDSDVVNITPENMINSLIHIPLIIAYKCSFETVFSVLRNVGEFANIIWIR